MRLFLFELKKMAWNRKFFIILVALICAVGALFGRNLMFQDYADEQQKKEAAFFMERSTSINRSYDDLLERLGEDEEIEARKELNLRVLRFAREFRDALYEDDWQTAVFIENQLMIAISEYKETGEDFPISDAEVAHRLAKNHMLLELDIPPEFEGYSTAYPNFLKQVVDVFISYGGVLIVLLLVGEILTREFENQSIQLLFTLPLERAKIIWAKFFSACIISIATFAVTIGVGVLIGKLFGEDGSFAYPVLVEKEGIFFYMPIMDYLFYVLLLFTIMMLFVIALHLFYSLVFKQLLAALFAVVVTLFAGHQLGNLVSWAPFAWVNPFQYLFPQNAVLYQNDTLFYQSIVVTMVLTLVLLIITVVRIRKEKLG